MAPPKAVTAPLVLVNQYPLPEWSAVMATIGRLWGTFPSEP